MESAKTTLQRTYPLHHDHTILVNSRQPMLFCEPKSTHDNCNHLDPIGRNTQPPGQLQPRVTQSKGNHTPICQ